MCSCDEYPPELYRVRIVKGRKRHRCGECLRDIEVGETHEYVSGKWEGHFYAFRTCNKCVNLRDSMNPECFGHGDLIDEVSQADPFTDDMESFQNRRHENWLRLQTAQK